MKIIRSQWKVESGFDQIRMAGAVGHQIQAESKLKVKKHV